jgi:hypothetical protein
MAMQRGKITRTAAVTIATRLLLLPGIVHRGRQVGELIAEGIAENPEAGQQCDCHDRGYQPILDGCCAAIVSEKLPEHHSGHPVPVGCKIMSSVALNSLKCINTLIDKYFLKMLSSCLTRL